MAPCYRVCGAKMSHNPAKAPSWLVGGGAQAARAPLGTSPWPWLPWDLPHPCSSPWGCAQWHSCQAKSPPREGAITGIRGKERGTKSPLLGKRLELPSAISHLAVVCPPFSLAPL